jgi:ABC-type uncharacterized transport system permease subunit
MGLAVPYQLFLVLPYLLALVVLALAAAGKTRFRLRVAPR